MNAFIGREIETALGIISAVSTPIGLSSPHLAPSPHIPMNNYMQVTRRYCIESHLQLAFAVLPLVDRVDNVLDTEQPLSFEFTLRNLCPTSLRVPLMRNHGTTRALKAAFVLCCTTVSKTQFPKTLLTINRPKLEVRSMFLRSTAQYCVNQ